MTVPAFGSRFLADPGDFPARIEGEPCGDRQRLLVLPGGSYLVSGLSEPQAELVDREYASIIEPPSSHAPDPLLIKVFRSPPEHFRSIDLNGWTYTLDLDSTPSELRIAALKFAGLVPWSSTTPEAGLWTSAGDEWFQGVIENFLRVVVAHRLFIGNGLLLHSSATVIDQTATVFLGASGAGKSTLAGKAVEAGAPVLSDDLNAVVGLPDAAEVAQLPFTGDMRDQDAFDGTVELRSLLVLEQGDGVRCTKLSRGEAVAAVVASAPFITCGGHNLEILVEKAMQLTALVPVARLTTAKASSFREITQAVQRFHETA